MQVHITKRARFPLFQSRATSHLILLLRSLSMQHEIMQLTTHTAVFNSRYFNNISLMIHLTVCLDGNTYLIVVYLGVHYDCYDLPDCHSAKTGCSLFIRYQSIHTVISYF